VSSGIFIRKQQLIRAGNVFEISGGSPSIVMMQEAIPVFNPSSTVLSRARNDSSNRDHPPKGAT
jgi:hypothetical protein